MVKQWYQVIPFRDTDEKIIMKFNWPRGTAGQAQSKLYKNILRYQLTFSRGIYYPRIVQSDWMKDITGHRQPKVVVSDAILAWWLTPCKKAQMLIDSLRRYSSSKNPAIWLDKRHTLPHPPKSVSPDATFSW